MPPGNQIEWSTFVHTLQITVCTGQKGQCRLRLLKEDGSPYSLKIDSRDPEHEEIKQITELVPDLGAVLYQAGNEADRLGAVHIGSTPLTSEIHANINIKEDGLAERLIGTMHSINLLRIKRRREHGQQKKGVAT